VPYIIEYGILIDQTLTIEAGTVIKFKANGWMNFGTYDNATLIAIGTEENPIVLPQLHQHLLLVHGKGYTLAMQHHQILF